MLPSPHAGNGSPTLKRKRRLHPHQRRASLLVLLALLVSYAIPASSQAAEVVERWQGTIDAYQSIDLSPALIPGFARERYTLRYDLKVDDEGFVGGEVEARLQAVSLDMTDSTCLGTIEDCSVSYTILDPQAIMIVKGERSTIGGKPVMRLEIENTVDTAHLQVETCGFMLGAFRICIPEEREWGPDLPEDYVITPYEHGRSPLATVKVPRFEQLGVIQTYQGQLVGVGEEPLLNLDPELLERSVFIAQVPVNDRMDANLDWNSADQGWVSWKVAQNPVDRVGPTRDRLVNRQVNVGFPQPGKKLVNVQAHNTLGKSSRPETIVLTAAPPPNPAMSGPPSNISATKQGDVVAYKYSIKFPDPAFKATKQVPAGIPFFGGAPIGVLGTQVSADVDVKSTGQGYVKGGAESGFIAMKQEIKGSVAMRAEVALDERGMKFPSGEFEFKIAGKIKGDEPLIVLIPPLAGPVSTIKRMSPAAASIINKAVVRLETEPKITTQFKLKDVDGTIQFVEGHAKPAIGLKAMLVLDIIKDELSVQAGVGGEVTVLLRVPEPNFQGADVKLLAFAKIALFHWGTEHELSYTGKVLPGLAANPVTDPGWSLLARSYLDDADYGRWTVSAPAVPVGRDGASDRQLVANLFPQANPSLAVLARPALPLLGTLTWAHDRAGTPALGGQEIMVAPYSFGSWADRPTELTRDNQADFNPQAVFLADTSSLIGWQRFDSATPGDLNTDPAQYLSHLQVAAARVHHGEQSEPVQISASGSLNHRPQFAATNNGAVAVWVNNPANQLLGDHTHPDNLLFSRYTAGDDVDGRWSAPTPIKSSIAGLTSLDLATAGPHTALVWSQDVDGDITTDADRELFYTRYVNGVWTAAKRLTVNNVADQAPQLALTNTGAPLLVWQQDGTLKFLHGNWSANPIPLALPDAAQRTDYELVRGGDGSLALTWQDVEPDNTRIGYALFNPASGRWTDQRGLDLPTIAGSNGMASGVSAALITGTGRGTEQLMAAYLRTNASSTTRAGTPNVPNYGTTSLHVASMPLRTNLSISPEDITVTPATGGKVQIKAAVHNTGHTSIGNVPVTLLPLSSDWGIPDTPIMTSTLPLLHPGQTYTVTFGITPPASAENKLAVSIERGDVPEALEDDYRDNRANLGTDVVISPLPPVYASDGIIAQAAVEQTTPIYASVATTATLRLGSRDGREVGTAGVSFPVTPTASLAATAWLDAKDLGRGRHTLYWQVDPGNALGSRNPEDKMTATSVEVLPDLSTDPALIGWDRSPGASSPISLRIQNNGNWPSLPSTVEVFDAEPGQSGTHSLGRIAVPALEPGAFAELNGTLTLSGLPAATSGLQSLYVQLDPTSTQDELDENNNILFAGQLDEPPPPTDPTATRVFLPFVRR